MTTRERVLEIITTISRERPDTTDETTLENLGMDSLDRVELLMGLEEAFAFEILDEDGDQWKTVGDVIGYVEDELKEPEPA